MAGIGTWRKLRLLVWKNLLLQRRSIIGTLFQILTPVLLVVLLCLTRGKTGGTHIRPTQYYTPISIDSIEELRQTGKIGTWELVYAPENEIFDGIMKKVKESLQLDGFVAVQSPDEMANVLFDQDLIAGIEFHHPSTITELPKKLEYSLRFPNKLRIGHHTWRTERLFRRDNIFQYDDGEPDYIDEGFSAIQNAIAEALVPTNQKWPTVVLQRFPTPSEVSTDQSRYLKMATFVPWFILPSFILFYISTIRAIVSEKENQLSELMKIMGLTSALQWASWFIRTMMLMTISITVIFFLLSLRIFTLSNGFILWIVFIIYGVSMTALSFFVSAFFTKAIYASIAAVIVWIASIVPYIVLTYVDLTFAEQFLMCLSPNIAMMNVLEQIRHLEIRNVGLQWSNLWYSGLYEDLSTGIVLVLLLFDSIVLFLFTLYIERVFPGTYGVTHPWYFPFTRAYWFGKLPQEHCTRSDERHVAHRYFEEVPKNLNLSVGIHVRQLRKVYANKKVAVDDLSIDMYESQITVLLGQNGAGKSTTISMLSGMLQATSGIVLINGHNIQTETEKVRSSFGFCPQNNILFDELTVREHILFYAQLKGLSSPSAQQEAKKYTDLLSLSPEKRSKALSGGMKRKLSLAMALCGDAKFVLCDEPSSGMDPLARRELWQVLENEKKCRTILLTTHDMEEADILGDRIAIMADGRLKCCGTPFFLKKRFGAGYNLVCVKNDKCFPEDVTKLLKKYVPNVSLSTNIGAELSYHLHDADTSVFERMFQDLENNLQSLHLSSFGVSLTTLEDVFHKILGDLLVNDGANHGISDSGGHSETVNATTELLHGFGLVINQWYALFRKKWLYWTRNWILFALMNAILILSLTGIAIDNASSGHKSTASHRYIETALEITLDKYSKSVTILDESSADDSVSTLMEQYKNAVREQSSQAELRTNKTNNMEQYFLDLAAPNPYKVNRKYLAGVTFTKADDEIIAWFNGFPYHSVPLALNLVHNAIVRTLVGPDRSIHLYNHPLVKKVKFNGTESETSHNTPFLPPLQVFKLSQIFALILASYIIAYIKERECKSKLLQLMTGVNALVYWGTSFLWDICMMLVEILIIIIVVAPCQFDYWSSPGELWLLFIFLFVFAIAVLQMTYVFSLLFKSTSIGMIIEIVIILFACFAAMFVEGEQFMDPELSVRGWELISIAFPHYSSSRIFLKVERAMLAEENCVKKCIKSGDCYEGKCSWDVFAWEKPGIGFYFTCMIASVIFYFAILMLHEYRIIKKLVFSISNNLKLIYIQIPASFEADNDVQMEKKRVNALVSSANFSSSSLILHNLTHFYGRFVAVNRLSVAIKPLECFGLLGVNGAGKTTAFKMLTGDECISDGDAWVCGVSVKEHISSVHKMVSYCPQFDALLGHLTGRETLEIFGLLHGIRRRDIETIAEVMAIKFDFMRHIDKKTSEYSGGNKRKLSTAIAFLGNPSVVYLDEPTAGLDPGARRHIWNMICHERSLGKTIVLTTHNMDECEALCSRAAIMVHGEFKCIGSMQHLKNKFSQGYEIMVKVKKAAEPDSDATDATDARTNEVKAYITNKLPGATLKVTHQNLLTYYVPPSDRMKWSTMFGVIESAKKSSLIEDYSIKQTSLEQVFLAMAQTD